MFRLRILIVFPVGRKLRVLIYARYSTDEQHPSSIDDQVAACKEFLRAAGVIDAEFIIVSDAEISGERVSRPGIDRCRELIDQRWPDIYISEDSGRLFRHETACGEHIETAVDLGIRYIAINDDVDTAEEDWDDRLHEAMRHHARSNKFTSKRIKRKFEGLWRIGAAVGMLRPGYRRKPSVPAAEGKPAEGPYFDEIDPKWAPVIVEAFERIARDETSWEVAQWLTERQLPKRPNAKLKAYSDKQVNALIQLSDYRGIETYRNTVVRKHFRTGKHNLVRNDPENVLTREMPHLQIVPDALWYAANEAIKKRTLRPAGPTGLDHPLSGIPRDSRGPLSGLFFCGVCGAKMHKDGRQEGGYRCSKAPTGECWNKATALVSHLHQKLGRAITEQLLSVEGTVNALVRYVEKLYADVGNQHARRAELSRKVCEGEAACQRLLNAIEEDDKHPPKLLTDRLRTREAELARDRAALVQFDAQAKHTEPPTRQQMLDAINEVARNLTDLNRESRPIVKRLVGQIRAVPFQQFGSNKVVLRAMFELRLVGLVDDQFLAALHAGSADLSDASLITIPMSVDLFERSAGPRLFARALQLSRAGKTLEEIGDELGVAKRQAHIAVQYGRDLESAGLTDPYIELTERPPNASRWRSRNQ